MTSSSSCATPSWSSLWRRWRKSRILGLSDLWTTLLLRPLCPCLVILYERLHKGDEAIFLRRCYFDFFDLPRIWPKLTRIIKHCSFLGRKSNFSSLPLMWSQISLAPTSMCASAVLRNGHPRMRVVSFWLSISSTTKSTGMKQSRTLTGTSSAIPSGCRTEESTNYNCIGVGVNTEYLSWSKTALGITLTLAPRSLLTLTNDHF